MSNKKHIKLFAVVIAALSALYFIKSRISSSNQSEYVSLALADHEKITSGSYTFEHPRDSNTITAFRHADALKNFNKSQPTAMAAAITAQAIAPFLNGNLPNTTPEGNNGIPALLSQTGAFLNTELLTTSPGLIPYDMIEPFWSDGALKQRWMAIPNDGAYDTSAEQITFSNDEAWDFPRGSVLIKNFEVGGKLLETRFEVKGNDDVYYYLTYKWNSAQTDATLLAGALDEDVVVNGVTQSWHYPSRTECASCHFPQNGSVLGPKTRHLNKEITYPSSGVTMNQLVNFSELGLITETITTGNVDSYPAVAAKDDLGASLEDRARSYIDVNCSSCHNPTVDNIAMFDARYTTPLQFQNIIYGDVAYDEGLMFPKVIIPQDVQNSMAHFRMNSTQNGVEMPPIAKDVVDTAGVQLIEDWINSLTPTTSSPPVALFSASTVYGLAPLSVDFDASGSFDADGDPLTYSWDFGDGNTSSGATVNHIFTNSGEHTVTLTVNDGVFSDQISTLITVNNSNPGDDTVSFTDGTNLLVNDNYSGLPMGVIDMNGDGKDDIVQFNQTKLLRINYQNGTGQQFTSFNHGDVGGSNFQWGTAIADFDHNGYNDVVIGGVNNGLRIIKNMNGNDNYVQSIIADSNPCESCIFQEQFLQGINFADINNDGWADIFACDDDSKSRTYENMTDGSFSYDENLIDTAVNGWEDYVGEISTYDEYNSGNYASTWMDYDNDGDLDLYISKCRGGATTFTDPRRINMLWQNDGNNNFTEVAEQANLDLGDQSWLTDFGDIDNDGDLDAIIINHYTPSKLMQNNGDGTFTDITSSSGLLPALSNTVVIQGFFKDFNNDGFLDLMVGARSNTNHLMFYNNGDGTFKQAPNPFGSNQIHSFSVGDLNHDGFLDIYAGYGKFLNGWSTIKDRIWLNQGNSNNFLNIQLKGTESNINAIGARVELHGAWGIQIRDVHSGEGYGLVNSFTQHFGIGVSTQVDKVVVRWPSGIVNEVLNPAANQFLVITEDRPIVYTFNNDVWTPEDPWSPSDPNHKVSYNDSIIVEAGAAEISTNTTIDAISVDPGAALIVDTDVILSTNTLTLKSTSQLYSSLILDGSVTGTISYERHVNINGSGETGSNDLISAPLTGETFGDFVSNNANIFSNPSNPTEKLFGPFDKTTGTYLTWDTNVPAEAAEILTVGVGYRAASSDNDIFTFTGTINNGVVTHNITNSGPSGAQWNLVGNPYPSYLNVQAFLNHQVSSGVSNLDLLDTSTAAIYGYDGSAQDGWTIYNLATEPSTLIAPGQGFFISADPANALLYDIEFTPAMRAIGFSDDFIVGDQNTPHSVLSTLTLSNLTETYSTRIYFIEGTTKGLDKGYDASPYGGVTNDFSIFTNLVEENQGLAMAIQALPHSDYNDISIPLGIKAQAGSPFTISLGDDSTLSNDVNVYLEDTLLNTLTLLNNSDFEFTPNIDLSGTGRFFIRYSNETLSTLISGLDDILIFSNNARSEIIIKGQLSGSSNVNIYDIHGRLVINKTLDNSTLINTINANVLSSGVYIVQLSNDNALKIQKIIID